MKSEILRMLKETDSYISGQALCEHFHVSRTAIWKVIKQLENEGYQIVAVRNKGYCLKQSGDILGKAELESSMTTQWAGRNIIYCEETDSTNNEAKKAAEAGAPHGTLAVADYQTAGKGRRGKNWTTLRGVGLWMSLMIRPQIHPMSASMLTLVAAMAVAEGIEEITGKETMIKWPNDIVCGGKKVCGILTEMSTELDYIHYVVTGIGVNVNIGEFPEDIREIATSLYLETGKRVSRSGLANSIMKAYEKYYDLFMAHGDMSGLIHDYNRLLVNKGRVVRVLKADGEFTGISDGINETGELLVRTEDGRIHPVISGEVSVRGIYGYV